jgi:hypothetical protein
VIKLRCVDLDVQARRDACIIIKFVGQQARDENENGLATGCGQWGADHVTDGCLKLCCLGHAFGNWGRVEGERAQLVSIVIFGSAPHEFDAFYRQRWERGQQLRREGST